MNKQEWIALVEEVLSELHASLNDTPYFNLTLQSLAYELTCENAEVQND